MGICFIETAYVSLGKCLLCSYTYEHGYFLDETGIFFHDFTDILHHFMPCRFGSKVAMFRYSSVEIYSACKPPLSLEFTNQNKKDWLDVEVNNVCFCNIFAAAAVYFPLANGILAC